MNDLYSHIEQLGKERGYKNMTVLCKSAGVPRSTMSELNNGRSSDLSKPNAQKFAMLLGVSLDDIYDIYGEQKEQPSVNDDEELEKLLEMYRTRPECRMLFSLADGATVEDVKKAAAIIEALRKVDGR